MFNIENDMDTAEDPEKGNTGPESGDRHKRRHKSGEKEVCQDFILQFTFFVTSQSFQTNGETNTKIQRVN